MSVADEVGSYQPLTGAGPGTDGSHAIPRPASTPGIAGLETVAEAAPTEMVRPSWARRHPRLWRCLKWSAVLNVLVLIVIPATAALYAAHAPPTTSFMWQDQFRDASRGQPGPAHPWVDGEAISRNVLVALVAHEDQQFPTRGGPFTMSSLLGRAGAYLSGRHDPSGSTVYQQLAKNLLYWRHHDPVRKALEADEALWLYHVASKKRILELYANTIEFGDNVYGVCAASWYYFNEPPRDVTVDQAAMLVGLLPNPKGHPRGENGGLTYRQTVYRNGDVVQYGDLVAWARAHVPGQMRSMGGLSVSEELGFHGLAADAKTAHGCLTMPDSVAALIEHQRKSGR